MKAEVIQGDCLEVMRGLADCSVDAAVCDPPYELAFMGKSWDASGVTFRPETWAEVFRVLKDGSRLLAFGGTRTYHRMACAIEDAGFIIEDCIMWVYGSGFPKHKSKLKPAYEPIIVARKGGASHLNIDACRIGIDESERRVIDSRSGRGFGTNQCAHAGRAEGVFTSHPQGRWPANIILDEFNEQVLRLMYNTSEAVQTVIREYFDGYNKLSELRDADRSPALAFEANEVLRAGVLREGALSKNGGRGTPALWQEAHARVAREDAGDKERTRQEASRSESPGLQGLLDESGLSLFERGDLAARAEGARVEDGSEGQARHSGAPPNDGRKVGASAQILRSGTPSQRRQARQQAGKPRGDGQLNAQERAQANPSGVARVEVTERGLEVLACDVPPAWLKYFEPTGLEVRSPHCAGRVLDEQSGIGKTNVSGKLSRGESSGYQGGWGDRVPFHYGDSGGASRFFYCAKASKGERGGGNNHPTVKPVALLRYICRLVTPDGGLILDSFAGSGTTGIAAAQEGFNFVGIEREPDYVEIARRRIAEALNAQPLFAEAVA